jgi:hypothetical protein
MSTLLDFVLTSQYSGLRHLLQWSMPTGHRARLPGAAPHHEGIRMRITLTNVTKGPNDSALPLTSLEFESGTHTLATAETERRPTVLGLIASGRMRPDSGTVTLDGRTDYAGLRRHIALIDALGVSEPAADVTVAEVVSEELMFAGRLGHRRAVAVMLDELGLGGHGRENMADLDPDSRIRLLTELAVLRDDVQGIVLTSPDRHGGDPLGWWQITGALADRGYAVLVIAGDASAHAINNIDRLGAEL